MSDRWPRAAASRARPSAAKTTSSPRSSRAVSGPSNRRRAGSLSEEPPPADATLTAGAAPTLDPGRILWLNNTLQILSTVAWSVVAPFLPLYPAAQGAQAVGAAASNPGARGPNYGYDTQWSTARAGVGPVIGGFVAGHFGYRTAFALVWVLMSPSLPIAGRLPGASAAPLRAVSLAMAHRLVHTILRERGVGAVLFISFIVVCAQTLQQ